MLGELAALGAALAWAIGSLAIKPISTSYSSLSINSLRTGTAWVVLVATLLPWGKMAGLSAIPWHSAAYIIGSGIIGLVIGTTLYIRSLSLVDVAIAYPISNSASLLCVAVIAATLLDEPITRFTVLGAILILFGIALLATPSRSSQKKSETKGAEAKGIVFALLSGLCWAIGVASLKVGLDGVDPLVANVFRLPLVALVLVTLVLKRQGISGYKKYTARTLLLACTGGIFDQAVGAVLFFISIHLAGAAKATIISSTSLLFVASLSLIFLGERMTWRIAVGTVACVGGIWLSIL